MHISARATLSMTTLLTLAGMFGSLSSFTPQISYTTKLDNWMVTSMIFVFITLLELVGALMIKIYLMDITRTTDPPKVTVWATKTDEKQKEPSKKDFRAEQIDKILVFAEKCFTLLYFSVYIIFCLAYWLAFGSA